MNAHKKGNKPTLPSSGMTLIELLIIVAILAAPIGICAQAFHKHTLEKRLNLQADGIKYDYYRLKSSKRRINEARADLNLSIKPDAYTAALLEWAQVTSPDPMTSHSSGVAQIESQEQADAKAWLSKEKISQDDIFTLYTTLNKPAPELSKKERRTLVKLTSTDSLKTLASIRDKSTAKFIEHLHTLGYDDKDFKTLGFDDWIVDKT